ncbi:MAG: hypothetical protein LBS59_01670 [Puniceicoccales bacterium]|nr:hypothetical protein [Puniceicoccales bacterium]
MNNSDLNVIDGVLKIWTAASAASLDFETSSSAIEKIFRLRVFGRFPVVELLE